MSTVSIKLKEGVRTVLTVRAPDHPGWTLNSARSNDVVEMTEREWAKNKHLWAPFENKLDVSVKDDNASPAKVAAAPAPRKVADKAPKEAGKKLGTGGRGRRSSGRKAQKK